MRVRGGSRVIKADLTEKLGLNKNLKKGVSQTPIWRKSVSITRNKHNKNSEEQQEGQSSWSREVRSRVVETEVGVGRHRVYRA